MDTSINAPIGVADVVSKWVWYSSNAALSEGEAVCYNWDYGTATARSPRRFNEVETPSTTNAQYFAGVSAASHSAKSGGQLIEIYAPGSLCNILIADDTVIGVGLLTFDVTSSYKGVFRYAGLAGEGSAIPMQTVTYASGTAQVCLAKLQVGEPSGGVEVVPLVATGAIGTLMIGGTTLITGGSIASGNNTYTLADGTRVGLRKKFGIITVELTSYDVIVTVSSGATDDVDDVSLDTVTWANGSTCINTYVTLDWDGSWMVQGRTEDVPALAGS